MPSIHPAPPQRPVLPRFDGDPGPARWVSALESYLVLRDQRVDPGDPEDLLEWLRLTQQREKIPEGRMDRRRHPDIFGLQRPPQETLLNWRAPIESSSGQALGTARIESVGKEALVMGLPFDLRRNQRYRILLRTGADSHAALILLPLWQAQTQVNRWRIGAVVLSLRLGGKVARDEEMA